MVGDEAVQHDVVVLEPLGLVDREQQRRGEALARLGLVLVAHHQHGKAGGLAHALVELAQRGVLVRHQHHLARLAADRIDQEVALAVDRAEAAVLDLQQGVGHPRGLAAVAEVGGEHRQLLPPRELRVAPEQALHLAPGEEVGMHDLVRIAAQQEVAGLLQRRQHQVELRRGEVLHLVDDDEVVARRRQGARGLRDQAEVEQAGLGQPGAVLVEQVVQPLAGVRRKDRLAHAQRQVVGAAQHPAGTGGDHAADLLEGLMRVDVAESLPHAREPRREVAPARLAPGRHADRFDELAEGQEARVLAGVLEAVGVVQVARTLRQVGRVRDVEHLALGVLELFQRQRGLAAAGAADQDQGRRPAVDRLLRVVEGQRLVEQVDRGVLGVQVAQRLRLAHRGIDVGIGDLRLVDLRAAQEARLVVGVVGDHLQHQHAGLVTVAQQREQQAVGVVEARAVIGAATGADQLLHLRRTKIPARQRLADLGVGRAHARGVESRVFENLHCHPLSSRPAGRRMSKKRE